MTNQAPVLVDRSFVVAYRLRMEALRWEREDAAKDREQYRAQWVRENGL